MFECVWREKLSGIKDKDLWKKIFTTFAMPLSGIGSFYYAIVTHGHGIDTKSLAGILAVYCAEYAVFNIGTKLINLKEGTRKIDYAWEFILPQVEFDKVARTLVYLQVKGRRLVRETREEK